jgi:hypothetical protein
MLTYEVQYVLGHRTFWCGILQLIALGPKLNSMGVEDIEYLTRGHERVPSPDQMVFHS